MLGTAPAADFERSCVLTLGTVLDDGEDPGSDRALGAAGHAAALAYHAMHLRGRAAGLPGGPEWVSALEAFPQRERHLALHEGHLIEPNERDRAVVSGETLAAFGLARTAGAWRDHLAAQEAAGATEIAYQPAGPDIAGELRRFIEMTRG